MHRAGLLTIKQRLSRHADIGNYMEAKIMSAQAKRQQQWDE